MNNTKFSKDPGYLYDLYSLFTLHHNERCMELFSDPEQHEEDGKYFENILSEFAPFSDELFLFFYMKDEQPCFMSQFYYTPYLQQSPERCTLAAAQSEMTNHKEVTTRLIRFYFPQNAERVLEDWNNDPASVGKYIRDSEYNNDVKSSLYSYFVDPDLIIQKLSYELMEKDFRLSQRYEKEMQRIFELFESVDTNRLFEALDADSTTDPETDPETDSETDTEPETFISICLLFRNCFFKTDADRYTIILLGSDYRKTLKSILADKNFSRLDVLCRALSDKNRLAILDFIYRQGEATVRDVESAMEMPSQSAYYHLSWLQKADMLNTRGVGRMIAYSICDKGFLAIQRAIDKYIDR